METVMKIMLSFYSCPKNTPKLNLLRIGNNNKKKNVKKRSLIQLNWKPNSWLLTKKNMNKIGSPNSNESPFFPCKLIKIKLLENLLGSFLNTCSYKI